MALVSAPVQKTQTVARAPEDENHRRVRGPPRTNTQGIGESTRSTYRPTWTKVVKKDLTKLYSASVQNDEGPGQNSVL